MLQNLSNSSYPSIVDWADTLLSETLTSHPCPPPHDIDLSLLPLTLRNLALSLELEDFDTDPQEILYGVLDEEWGTEGMFRVEGDNVVFSREMGFLEKVAKGELEMEADAMVVGRVTGWSLLEFMLTDY